MTLEITQSAPWVEVGQVSPWRVGATDLGLDLGRWGQPLGCGWCEVGKRAREGWDGGIGRGQQVGDPYRHSWNGNEKAMG